MLTVVLEHACTYWIKHYHALEFEPGTYTYWLIMGACGTRCILTPPDIKAGEKNKINHLRTIHMIRQYSGNYSIDKLIKYILV